MNNFYYEYYKDIKKLKKNTLRDKVRFLALDGFSLINKLKDTEQFLNKPRVQFIYIHHVFKDEEKHLHKLLEFLLKNHTFIGYNEAVEKIINNQIDKPYISFSTDDGFKNNLSAAGILNSYQAKACFFINPLIIGETNRDIIQTHCRSKLNFPPIEFLNWDEVNQIQKLGHEIGSHTMNHMKISEMEFNEVINDLGESFDIINKRCGKVLHFAYPYGRYFHFNEKVKNACFDVGYKTCASAERGCHINSNRNQKNEDLFIRRDHVILDWKLDHIKHFLINNSKNANPINNFSPYK